MKQLGRTVVFFVALGAVAVIVGGGVWLTRKTSGGGVSACTLGSPEEIALESYMQLHAEELLTPVGSDDSAVTFVVEPGETAVEVAQRLQEASLVADAELFRRYLQYEGLDAGLEAGTFTLRQTMTIPEIAQALQSGQRPERVVTIREGLRLEQVVADIAAQTGIPEADLMVLVTTGWRNAGLGSYDFLSTLPADATLEGFLFPETYRLPEEATAYDVVARMLATFDEQVTSDMRMAAANEGLTVYEMVTLAAIVEREAVLDDERPLIAGVYFNRINDSWYLGADPTVQYALGYQASSGQWWKQPLLLDDLEVESPYNTYHNLGLPPGPICSPGLASIDAVAYPDTTAYFYFMADCQKNDGSHLFATTLEEHNANYATCGGTVP